MTVHRQQIRNETVRFLQVSKHIYDCGKGKFSVFPFYQMKTNNKIEREAKEDYFINKYKPELNNS